MVATLSKTEDRSKSAGAIPEKIAPIIGVLGSKGGTGATTLAVNLSASLAKLDAYAKVTLVDANLQRPDVAVNLATEPLNSLLDLLYRSNSMDSSLFEACRYEVSNSDRKLGVISGPLSGHAAVRTNLSEIASGLQKMRDLSSVWLIDLPGMLDRHLVTLLDSCTVLVLVVEPTLTGIAGCKRWLGIFRELGYDEKRLIIVLNKARGRNQTVEQEFLASLQDFNCFLVPDAGLLLEQCALSGEPLVLKQPREKYSKALTDLARVVSKICQVLAPIDLQPSKETNSENTSSESINKDRF